MPSAEGSEEFAPFAVAFIAAVRRSWWIIVLWGLIAANIAIGVSLLREERYRATAEVLVDPRSSSVFGDEDPGPLPAGVSAVETEIRLIGSNEIRQLVAKRLGTSPPITVTVAGQSSIIVLTAHSNDASHAAEIANAYAATYVEHRQSLALEVAESRTDRLAARIAALQTELFELGEALDPASQARRIALASQQATLEAELDEAQLDARDAAAGTRVLTPATAPASPYTPKPLRNGVAGLLVGLLGGLGAAVLRDVLDDRVRGEAEVVRVAGALPILGRIPDFPRKRTRRHGGARLLPDLRDLDPVVIEAYRTLRTNLQFPELEHPRQMIAITSAVPGEGKTTAAAHLAIVLAQLGLNVVVVSCDFRKPTLHEVFDVSNDVGLTTLFGGTLPLIGVLQPVPAVPNLKVLSAGPPPPNPTEILASPRSKEVFAGLRASADVVVLDCPPVLPVADALVVSEHADGTILVAAAGLSSTRDVSRALQALERADGNVMGMLVTRLPRERGYYGYA